MTSERLALDTDNALLAGVCAGCARRLGIDLTWVRIGTVVTGLFLPKVVVAAYLIAWAVLDKRRRR